MPDRFRETDEDPFADKCPECGEVETWGDPCDDCAETLSLYTTADDDRDMSDALEGIIEELAAMDRAGFVFPSTWERIPGEVETVAA